MSLEGSGSYESDVLKVVVFEAISRNFVLIARLRQCLLNACLAGKSAATYKFFQQLRYCRSLSRFFACFDEMKTWNRRILRKQSRRIWRKGRARWLRSFMVKNIFQRCWFEPYSRKLREAEFYFGGKQQFRRGCSTVQTDHESCMYWIVWPVSKWRRFRGSQWVSRIPYMENGRDV